MKSKDGGFRSPMMPHKPPKKASGELRELTEEEQDKSHEYCFDDCPLDGQCSSLICEEWDAIRITPDGTVVLVLGELK